MFKIEPQCHPCKEASKNGSITPQKVKCHLSLNTLTAVWVICMFLNNFGHQFKHRIENVVHCWFYSKCNLLAEKVKLFHQQCSNFYLQEISLCWKCNWGFLRNSWREVFDLTRCNLKTLHLFNRCCGTQELLSLWRRCGEGSVPNLNRAVNFYTWTETQIVYYFRTD